MPSRMTQHCPTRGNLNALRHKDRIGGGLGRKQCQTLILRYRHYLVVFTICIEYVVHFYGTGHVRSGEPAMSYYDKGMPSATVFHLNF